MKGFSQKAIAILWQIIIILNIITTLLWYHFVISSEDFAMKVIKDHICVEYFGVTSLGILVLCWWLETERKTNRPYLISSLIFVLFVILCWQVEKCCDSILIPCLLYTIVSILMFTVALAEKGVLIIINPTKYTYFNRTSFYFSDSRKSDWYNNKELGYNKINKMIDGVIRHCHSELNKISENSDLSELVYYARTTQCVLSIPQLNETIKRLDNIIENEHLTKEQILHIFEIIALLRVSNEM